MKCKKIKVLAVMFVGIFAVLTGCGAKKYDEIKPMEFPENAELTYFLIHHDGMAMEPYYILTKSDRGTYLKYVTMNTLDFEKEEFVELQSDDPIILNLKNAIEQYGALGWDGYEEKVSKKDVLDSGDSYQMKIRLSDGTSVVMKGYNTCPAGFEDLLRQVTDSF